MCDLLCDFGGVDGAENDQKGRTTAFTVAFAGLIGFSTVHTDSTGIIDGLWRERKDALDQGTWMQTYG